MIENHGRVPILNNQKMGFFEYLKVSFLSKKCLLYVKKYLGLFVSQNCVFPRNKGIVPGKISPLPAESSPTCSLFVFSAQPLTTKQSPKYLGYLSFSAL